jgi:hypothetical protein
LNARYASLDSCTELAFVIYGLGALLDVIFGNASLMIEDSDISKYPILSKYSV